MSLGSGRRVCPCSWTREQQGLGTGIGRGVVPLQADSTRHGLSMMAGKELGPQDLNPSGPLASVPSQEQPHALAGPWTPLDTAPPFLTCCAVPT